MFLISNMTPQILVLLFINLFISNALGQCAGTGFDAGTEVESPLDVITFDNLGTSVPWSNPAGAIRITNSSAMAVTMTGVTDAYVNYVLITTGSFDLKGASWNKTDYFAAFQSFRNTATLTFASLIRQFSVKISHVSDCAGVGWYPRITALDVGGAAISCLQFNSPPPAGSTNAYTVYRFRSTTANIQSIFFSGCAVVFDDLSYKVDPCSPNPCNSTTENCFDTGLDATCCPLNTIWTGTKCGTGNPCIDDTPCDPLATCDSLRTGSYTCTCPPTYIGNGSPGNCTLLQPSPSNVTYNIVPVLECIDEHNVAQFGYISNETSVLLINDPLRNNLKPLNIAPVIVFKPGKSRGYPLNPGQVLLNVTATEYVWQLESSQLTFSKQSALACPIQINIILHFTITGTVNLTLFGQQVRSAFIFATNVQSDRVTLVNVTIISTSANKRSMLQQDLTELEVELSVAPPTNDTQPSAAEVVRDFVSNQQDDLQYDLNQSNPNVTISASVVTTKGAPLSDPPLGPPMTSEAPSAIEMPSSLPPSESPTSFIASSAPTTHFYYLSSLSISLQLLLMSVAIHV